MGVGETTAARGLVGARGTVPRVLGAGAARRAARVRGAVERAASRRVPRDADAVELLVLLVRVGPRRVVDARARRRARRAGARALGLGARAGRVLLAAPLRRLPLDPRAGLRRGVFPVPGLGVAALLRRARGPVAAPARERARRRRRADGGARVAERVARRVDEDSRAALVR